METAEKVVESQQNNAMREEFIKENIPFIRNCAAKAAGCFVSNDDDIFSEALKAFDDAISSYDTQKGYFHSFAKVCINNRVKDYFKKQNKHKNVIPLSSLTKKNDNDEDVEFDIEDTNDNISDTAFEVYSLKTDLQKFDISFFDIPDSAPKMARTRKVCVKVARYIVENKTLLDSVYEKKVLPSKQILSALKVNKKVLERYRKYIIMGILILNENYEILSEYFDSTNGRCE